MEMNEFIRKPFVVEAVEITEDNIYEVAKYVGDVIEEEGVQPYIQADRRLAPGATRVYIGFFMTRMNDHIRCYPRGLFFDQFTPLTGDVQKWVDFLNKTTPTPTRREA